MKGRINEPLSERPTSYAGWRRRNSVNGLRNSSAGWMMRRFAMRCLRRAVHHDREWRERGEPGGWSKTLESPDPGDRGRSFARKISKIDGKSPLSQFAPGLGRYGAFAHRCQAVPPI